MTQYLHLQNGEATPTPSLRSLEPSKLVQALPSERLLPCPPPTQFPLQGPDFGYVTREPQGSSVSGLDSFGNLEVSPPVVANGKTYPLGRILIGGNLPG